MDDLTEEISAMLSSFTIVNCTRCRKKNTLGNTGLFVVRMTAPERYNYEIYCDDCWDETKRTYEWGGVLAVFVYDPILVHSLFGYPFDRLKPVEGGVVLFANNIKARQMELF